MEVGNVAVVETRAFSHRVRMLSELKFLPIQTQSYGMP